MAVQRCVDCWIDLRFSQLFPLFHSFPVFDCWIRRVPLLWCLLLGWLLLPRTASAASFAATVGSACTAAAAVGAAVVVVVLLPLWVTVVLRG